MGAPVPTALRFSYHNVGLRKYGEAADCVPATFPYSWGKICRQGWSLVFPKKNDLLVAPPAGLDLRRRPVRDGVHRFLHLPDTALRPFARNERGRDRGPG